jgi:hypothetical protein
LFKIDLAGATDISQLSATEAAAAAVPKTLFVDLVASLKAAGWDPAQIPAKIEGISFGPDVQTKGSKVHTLWVANDNDFLNEVALKDGSLTPNDNQFFVFGFTEDDLGGARFVPQKVGGVPTFAVWVQTVAVFLVKSWAGLLRAQQPGPLALFDSFRYDSKLCLECNSGQSITPRHLGLLG